MSNFIEQHPIMVVAGAIGVGLFVRSYLNNKRTRDQAQAEMSDRLASNPWLGQSGNAMDLYQYYQVTNSNTRLVYGVGNEVNLVSTEMLDNALKNEHDKTMQEVRVMMNALSSSFDEYLYNPYNTAIAGAAAGNQMSWPIETQGEGGHD